MIFFTAEDAKRAIERWEANGGASSFRRTNLPPPLASFSSSSYAVAGPPSPPSASAPAWEEDEVDEDEASRRRRRPTSSPGRRRALVRSSLLSRSLEDGTLVRDLSAVLGARCRGQEEAAAAAGGEEGEGGGGEGEGEGEGGGSGIGIDLARTWRAAESSVRTMVGLAAPAPAPECSICLAPYAEGDTVVFAKADACSHVFHEECLVRWLKDHDECPLCRTTLVEDVGVEGGGKDDRDEGGGGGA